ncbi:hypothetical protein KM043_003121 [Ampulex compressa]|nr:hypothetical protein KM043_003121 [Ampulex compressa]
MCVRVSGSEQEGRGGPGRGGGRKQERSADPRNERDKPILRCARGEKRRPLRPAPSRPSRPADLRGPSAELGRPTAPALERGAREDTAGALPLDPLLKTVETARKREVVSTAVLIAIQRRNRENEHSR